ncbi:MAG TPA: bifunctional fructose-bisphosphatase/inositol-phosphate phosphatase [Methanotrichaceae archaeon]|nr:bifunctional fructose-bisphosphatase/inositol-phosphate phosphatase [Methanotrichaceae archaeon]
MSEQLSPKGYDLKNLCDSISSNVFESIRDLVGTPESGLTEKIGADGTPTKSIDRIAEDAILSRLKASGKGFKVLSEEIGEVQIGERPEYLIHLDPLDGTFNAIKGIPFYSVSIYLSGGDCHFGYVCNLASGVKYYAELGKGAFSEPGGRLRVSGTSGLTDFSISAYTLRPNTSRIVGIGDRVRRIRTLGSTSLEMALVASGRLDAFVDLRGMLRVVDVAAGKLILEEAGGIITDVSGKPLELNGDMWQKTDLIGSNGLLHEELLHLIGGGGH